MIGDIDFIIINIISVTKIQNRIDDLLDRKHVSIKYILKYSLGRRYENILSLK